MCVCVCVTECVWVCMYVCSKFSNCKTYIITLSNYVLCPYTAYPFNPTYVLWHRGNPWYLWILYRFSGCYWNSRRRVLLMLKLHTWSWCWRRGGDLGVDGKVGTLVLMERWGPWCWWRGGDLGVDGEVGTHCRLWRLRPSWLWKDSRGWRNRGREEVPVRDCKGEERMKETGCWVCS